MVGSDARVSNFNAGWSTVTEYVNGISSRFLRGIARAPAAAELVGVDIFNDGAVVQGCVYL